ncbi:SUMF1/EgtB/PvdO family nonheme iron enzyme [Sulfidibacter corallicola]|uniref:SUMF1/EgtB/PvdO family nonheme iron enzyme n=1 Tax=Sulfidibacter corallicola TaxID=2818388 RepID=A0A8A4TPT8_SULCO|nr:SUMF1/EgtB/PvdO family nonheme iron enzyme [Sulfidibacter corallicola]QTD51447.1 SUMF1/EgtB/PvdO family nonheme iron enzyme [Sulfidibacter corallicola]
MGPEKCPACFEAHLSEERTCLKCGFSFDAPEQGEALPVGTRLRDLFLLGRLLPPESPFGYTYLAWDEDIRLKVSIFEYAPRGVAYRDDRGPGIHVRDDRAELLFDTGLEALQKTAVLLAGLSHSSLAKVRTSFLEHGTLYVVKELNEGTSLPTHLVLQRFTEAGAIHRIMPMLAALELCHGAGLLHLNLQPPTIWVNRQDHLVLDHFAAEFRRMATYAPDLRAGFDPVFSAPELADPEGKIGVQADVFSCGALLAWLLRLQPSDFLPAAPEDGEPGAEGDEEQTQEVDGEAGSDADGLDRPSVELLVSQELQEVVHQAIHPDLNVRFAEVRQLRAALSRVPAYKEHLALAERGADEESALPGRERQAAKPDALPSWVHSDWPGVAFGLGALTTTLGVWQEGRMTAAVGMGLTLAGIAGGLPKLVAAWQARSGGRRSRAAYAPKQARWRAEYYNLAGVARDTKGKERVRSYLQERFQDAERRKALAEMQDIADTFANHVEGQDGRTADFDEAIARVTKQNALLEDMEQAWHKALRARDLDEMERLIAGFKRHGVKELGKREKALRTLSRGRKKYVCTKYKLELMLVPAGAFLMGANDGEPDERPVTPVNISRPFYLGRFPVTQQQWYLVMKTRPWKGRPHVAEHPDAPATYISWLDCRDFVNRLNASLGVNHYRMATEAEWEFACRAGHADSFYFGHARAKLGRFAWFVDNSSVSGTPAPQPVGRRKNNVWGLYDMIGNVWEWCRDSPWRYPGTRRNDPFGSDEHREKMMRGGCYDNVSWLCRSSVRGTNDREYRGPDVGFRLARSLD